MYPLSIFINQSDFDNDNLLLKDYKLIDLYLDGRAIKELAYPINITKDVDDVLLSVGIDFQELFKPCSTLPLKRFNSIIKHKKTELIKKRLNYNKDTYKYTIKLLNLILKLNKTYKKFYICKY